MSQNITFVRKVIYIVAIALLLFPLFLLGQPATRDSAGGVLARLREQYGLSQANLGEIDPASESMKLATLGLRGIAANLLWEKAFDYKKHEDWDSLSATLNQITKLQPNFVSVWEFQSHNLAYNVSAEFDDYRMRYHWVTKGIGFVIEGTHYNRDNPRLLHWTGWMMGQKIGRADEHVQFRELFRNDEDFHEELNREVVVDEGIGYDGRPDNWLVGRLWYERAERAVDRGIPLRGKSPLIFYADNPMSYINYASTIEEEGILGQKAQLAWSKAADAWKQYGRRSIPSTWGHNIRLGDYENAKKQAERMRERLDEMLPGVRDQLKREKIAALSPELREALEIPEDELDAETGPLHYQALNKTAVTHEEVAERAPPELRDEAAKLAARLKAQETLVTRIAHYRGTVNYEYWEIRCAAEQQKDAVDAREYLYEAKKAHEAAELETARSLYERAWPKWKAIFDKYPRLMDDVQSEDLIKDIKRYRQLLQQLDEDLPKDFVLRDFVLRRDDEELVELFKGSDVREEEPASTPPDEPAETETAPGKPTSDTSRAAAPEQPGKRAPGDASAKEDSTSSSGE